MFVASCIVTTWLSLQAAPAVPEGNPRQQALALNHVTGEDAILGQIEILAANPLFARRVVAEAANLVKEQQQKREKDQGSDDPVFFYPAAYILGESARRIEEYDAAALFYRIALTEARRLHSTRKILRAFIGQYAVVETLFGEKRYDDVVKYSQDFLEVLALEKIDFSLNDEFLRIIVRAKAKLGKTEEALRVVNDLLKAGEDDWRNHELKGWLLRELERYDDAIKVYEAMYDLFDKDVLIDRKQRATLKDNLRYLLSGLFIEVNRLDKAEEHLLDLLKKHPDSPAYNNDLGYIWADNDKNLDEAERMIRKALEEDRKQRQAAPDFKPGEDKDNPAYLDSLGWVLYKKKQYEEAKKYLLKAVEQEEGRHIEILDHLAEVHIALGEKAKAIAVWKQALEMTAETRRDRERKGKIERKLQELRAQP